MDFNHTIDFGLFFGCALRQFDGQYTIADVGTDFVFFNIVRQNESLLELGV